jgi:nucleoside-diphosphate-sugar epimerase
LKSIRNNKAIIIGKGTNSFSITHVGNICYGLSLILTKQSPDLRIYNLVDPEPVQVKTIYDSLFSTLGINAKIVHIPPGVALSLGYILEHVYKYLRIKQSPLLTADIARQFTQESTLSTALITKELGYHPHLTYTEGFRDLHQWINSIGGLQTYLSKPVDSWSGNLITY